MDSSRELVNYKFSMFVENCVNWWHVSLSIYIVDRIIIGGFNFALW